MKLALVHFQPLEYYPPLLNISNYIADKFIDSDVRLYTNWSDTDLKARVGIKKVFRVTLLNKKDNKLTRLFKVLHFNCYVAYQLFLFRPTSIFYIETTSSFPVFLYMLIFPKRARLFIHYHEYTSRVQYKQGMLLDRIWHFFEKKFLYKKAFWISQTNSYRIDMFLRDHKDINPRLLKELPNYPPMSWIVDKSVASRKYKAEPYRIIQLGSISTKHMYAKEFFNWIQKMNGRFLLDIYTFNIQQDLLDYLDELKCPFIQQKGSINYAEIPVLLSDYDIGVILYKANSENVIYCASNKLFEYLSGSLDVWVTSAMLGSVPYLRSDCYPKVSFVDFSTLDQLNWEDLVNRKDLSYKTSPYYMENVYSQLVNHFV